MSRNGDVRSALQTAPTKRRRVDSPPMYDCIVVNTSESSSHEYSGLAKTPRVKKVKAPAGNVARPKSPSKQRSLSTDTCSSIGTTPPLATLSKRRPLRAPSRSPALSDAPPRPGGLAAGQRIQPIVLSDDEDEDDLPTPRAIKEHTLPAVTTSFESSSTLSAPLPSSQMSEMSTKSQRIHRNGEELVTNSSSDVEDLTAGHDALDLEQDLHTDDEDDDLDDDDIETMIARKREALAAEREANPNARQKSPGEVHQLRARSAKKNKPDRRMAYPTPPKQEFKHNLDDLLKQKKKQQALEERLRELEEQDRLAAEKFEALQALDDDDEAQAKMAATKLGQQGDINFRLRIAVNRMDALEQDITFYFFETVPDVDPTRLPFPPIQDHWDRWMKILEDPTSRDHAVLTGFIADLCSQTPLPPELQEWLLGEILFETREHIAEAYVHILAACSEHEPHTTLLDLPMLRDSMTRLGAKDDIVYESNDNDDDDDDTMIEPEAWRPAKGGRQGLTSMLLLLYEFRERLRPKTQELAFYYCALMLIDDEVTTSISTTTRIQQTLNGLLDGISEDVYQHTTTSVARRLLSRLTNSVLLERLISRLLPTTQRMSRFRRQLSYQSITAAPFPILETLTSPSTWHNLRSALRDSEFVIAEKTDYLHLSARISILDTAIGPGFSDFSFLSAPRSEQPKVEGQNKAALFFAPRQGPQPISEAEKEFNAGVDSVLKWARYTSDSIRGVGAAHVRRTECKGAVDRLIARLESTVRTRAKKRTEVFAGR